MRIWDEIRLFPCSKFWRFLTRATLAAPGGLISLSAFFGSEKKSFLTDQKKNLFRQIRKKIFSDGHMGWGTLRKAFEVKIHLNIFFSTAYDPSLPKVLIEFPYFFINLNPPFEDFFVSDIFPSKASQRVKYSKNAQCCFSDFYFAIFWRG